MQEQVVGRGVVVVVKQVQEMDVVHDPFDGWPMTAGLRHETPKALDVEALEENAAVVKRELRPEQSAVGNRVFEAAGTPQPRIHIDAFAIIPQAQLRYQVLEVGIFHRLARASCSGVDNAFPARTREHTPSPRGDEERVVDWRLIRGVRR